MKLLPASIPHSLIIGAIIFLGLAGVASPNSYNFLPVSGILEFVLILAGFLCSRKIKLDAFLFAVTSFLYVAVCYLLSQYFFDANYLDFLQAYKAFIYLSILPFFLGSDALSRDQLKRFLDLLIFLFLVKYIYSRVLDLTPRMGERPGLFVENNFELVFLLIIYYISIPKIKNTAMYFILILVIVLLSGSRSAFLSLFVVFVFSFVKRFDFYTLFGFLFLPVVLMFGFLLFQDRMSGGIESVDRYKFMLVFISEIDGWSVLNYLFGTFPITPLSVESCLALSFYSDLFSYKNDGSCYSVILHSYVFRAIFDHGILGFAFVIAFYWWAAKKCGYSIRDRLCLLGIMMASALSVSSFNSVFSVLAFSLVFSIKDVKFINKSSK